MSSLEKSFLVSAHSERILVVDWSIDDTSIDDMSSDGIDGRS